MFDPMQASWSQPQTHVSIFECDLLFYALNACMDFGLLRPQT